MIKLIDVSEMYVDPESWSPKRNFTFALDYETTQDQRAIDPDFYETIGRQFVEAMMTAEPKAKD